MKCPKCGENVSSFKSKCPACGCDFAKYDEEKRNAEKQAKYNHADENRALASEMKREVERLSVRSETDNEASRNQLRANGEAGYWEYKVFSIEDGFLTGGVKLAEIASLLNSMASMGWRLKIAYTNEVGKNAAMVSGLGANATVDQNVLIFERFVKF